MDAGRDQHICDLLHICLGPSLPLFFLFFLNFLRPLLPTLHLWPIMASPAFLKLPLNVLVQIPERDWLAQLIFLSSPWSNHWRGRCSLEEVRERGAGQITLPPVLTPGCTFEPPGQLFQKSHGLGPTPRCSDVIGLGLETERGYFLDTCYTCFFHN